MEERERERALEDREREKTSNLSLRSTKFGLSSCVGPRLKVEELVEGNAWTPKSRVFVGDLSGKFWKAVGFVLPGLRKAFSSL